MTETDTCGHRLTATGDTGTILPGGENQAEFVNHRSGSYPEDPDPDGPDPDDPDIDIPDDPTPGGEEDPDDPDDPENPEEPDDPDIEIPDDPTPGGDEEDPKDPGKDEPTSGGGEKDDKPKLPQTGQLWWPVLPLGAAGAGLLAVGAARRKIYHGKHF